VIGRISRGFPLLLLVLVLALAAPARADLAGGRAAFDAGDYATARNVLGPLAEGGDAEAQYLTGLMYMHGAGEFQDFEQAAAWFGKAAAQDHGYAQYSLGVLYEAGLGVKHSQGEAMLWFRRAANQGVLPALERMPRLGGGGR
jgi:TPR repeat protein